MNIEQTYDLIQSVSWKGSRLGLERMERLMALLGNPERELKFIHVAGTNGKGSVCAMLSSVLAAAGYTVGLYTSPHLISYEERFQINGQQITPAELAQLADRLAPCVETMEDKPTEFELLTAMALVWFAQKNCDIVILEVGLGGRLDATNVIPAPEAAVIMNIGLEHTEILGHTLAEIAGEKAGIIKAGCDVVAYPGEPEVEQVYRSICAEKHARLRMVSFAEVTIRDADIHGQRFRWNDLDELQIGLLGRHQIYNAAAALETLALLRERGWSISEQAVRQGLSLARWPARMEVLRHDPLFLLDGAHNPQCAQALADGLQALLPGRRFVFLAGVLADKDYPAIMNTMLPLAQEFICLTPDSERALPAGEFAEYLRSLGARAEACDDVSAGIRAALDAAGSAGCVVAFGSLYLAGSVRAGVLDGPVLT